MKLVLLLLTLLLVIRQPVAGTVDLATFQQQALAQHNYFRSLHCTVPLILNSSINTIAVNYAQYLATNDVFQNSDTDLGENLWAESSSVAILTLNGSAPTTSWYNGIFAYNYSAPGFSGAAGAFTQVIWKGTTQLGIGFAFNSDSTKVYVVANYYPPGNYEGEFPANVLPLCSAGQNYSTITTATPITVDLATFQEQALVQHNYFRSLHCTAPLTLNSSINTIAVNYAQYLAANDVFQHSKTSGLGEDLWAEYASVAILTLNGSTPTNSWYNEISLYNYSAPGFYETTGHFTQVIWKGTTQLGIGFAFNSDSTKVYVVANYYPPGNYEGEFPANVLPLCSGAQNSSAITTTSAPMITTTIPTKTTTTTPMTTTTTPKKTTTTTLMKAITTPKKSTTTTKKSTTTTKKPKTTTKKPKTTTKKPRTTTKKPRTTTKKITTTEKKHGNR